MTLQGQSSTGVIPENTPVEIRNIGTRRFVGEYGLQKWVIEPGAKTLAPYHAACLWFGDPRAVNIGDPNSRPEIQYRSREVDRLSVKYGLCGDPWYADDVDIDRETFSEPNNDHYKPKRYIAGRHPHFPSCEVFDLNGNRLYTVIDDPENTHEDEPITTTSETNVTVESIQLLQAQIKELQNRLLLQDPEAGAKTLTPSAPSTTPDSISGGIGSETRDPVVDPSDPDAQASADLPPKERALVAKRRPEAKQPPVPAGARHG